MKTKLYANTAAKWYALAYTLAGLSVGSISFTAFDSTLPRFIIISASYILAFISYIALAKLCDSPIQFASKVILWHCIISIITIPASFIVFGSGSSAGQLYMTVLTIGTAISGDVEPIAHLLISDITRKRKR